MTAYDRFKASKDRKEARMFHWRDNIYFGRLPDGFVRVVKFSDMPNVMWWHNEKAAMVCVMMGAVSHDTAAKVVAATDNYQRVANYRRDHLRDLIEAWLRRYHVELVGIPQLGGAV